ncbi:MAG: RDD family protein [Candidatus Nanopelagicus sp.]
MSWKNGSNLLPEASLGRRIIALVIDWTMCRLVASLFSPGILPENGFSTLLIFFFEVCLFTIAFGASAGQRIMGIKVLTYPDQQRVTAGKVALRTFLICLVFPAIFTNNGRPIHDFLTQSQTVRQP